MKVNRLTQFSDIHIRLAMFRTAFRYSLDHPFGTGKYFPKRKHLDENSDDYIIKKVLSNTPHNQFLVVLVYYGFIGFILVLAFYFLVLRSLAFSGRLAIQSKDSNGFFFSLPLVEV